MFIPITCSSLNENGPHRHMYLNTWYLVGGIVCEGLGGMVLLDDVCHWK